jgi:hypothetical protein
MDKGSQNLHSFHLAGIVPVAGQKLDFNFPWHDCLQPIGKNYLAVERAVLECAYAGCETIWVVCHDDMQPLIKHRLGEYVLDPVFLQRTRFSSEGEQQEIPIYYVPIHPKDRDKRDCLGWSVLYGALTAYWLSKTISKWVIPDRFYAAFPYGVYDPALLQPHRKQISSKKPFHLQHAGQNIKDNQYLGFTFDGEDFKKCRSHLRKEGTGEFYGYDTGRIPIEERWSARHFELDKVFECVNIEDANTLEVPWYYKIDSWDGLCNFFGSKERKTLDKPYDIGYHRLNKIGTDNYEEN